MAGQYPQMVKHRLDQNYAVCSNNSSMQRNVTSPEQFNSINKSNYSFDSVDNERNNVHGLESSKNSNNESPKLMPSQPKAFSNENSARSAFNKKKNASASTSRATSLVTRFRVGKRDSQPPEDSATYQSLDVTQFMSNLPQRRFRRRAVIIGINYVLTPDLLLRGSCNDAAAMALALINLYDFLPEEIVLLIDAIPAPCYRQNTQETEGEKSGENIPWKNRRPTRRNILLALNWLRAGAIPGDVLLFYFAGHGVQVDDMSGWEGEGYDEAILPMDFHGDETYVITAVMIRNLLLNVASDVQVTIILDCNGGQTMLDPAGTGKWNFIKGIKQRGVWPFVTDATDKVARAVYDKSAWMDKTMKKRGARPRFMPGVDVRSTKELLDPTLQKPSAHDPAKVKGYLFAAAPWSQSAIEAKMTGIRIIPITKDNIILKENHYEKHFAYHGVFSWCFITALQELLKQGIAKTQTKSVSFRRILAEVERRIRVCKSPQGGLPKLDQCPELTFYRTGGSDQRDFFLWPFGGRRNGVTYGDATPEISIQLPCVPHEQQYLSIWEAEEQLREAGENRRRNDLIFMRSATLSSSPAYANSRGVSTQRLISAPQPDVLGNSAGNVEESTDLSGSTGVLLTPMSPTYSSFAHLKSSQTPQHLSPAIASITQERDVTCVAPDSLGGTEQPSRTHRINNAQTHHHRLSTESGSAVVSTSQNNLNSNSISGKITSRLQRNGSQQQSVNMVANFTHQNPLVMNSNTLATYNIGRVSNSQDLSKLPDRANKVVQPIPAPLSAKPPLSYLAGSSMMLPSPPMSNPVGGMQRNFMSVYSTKFNPLPATATTTVSASPKKPEDFVKTEYTTRLITNPKTTSNFNQYKHVNLTENPSFSAHQTGLPIKPLVKGYMK